MSKAISLFNKGSCRKTRQRSGHLLYSLIEKFCFNVSSKKLFDLSPNPSVLKSSVRRKPPHPAGYCLLQTFRSDAERRVKSRHIDKK